MSKSAGKSSGEAAISAKDAWYPPRKRDRFIIQQLVSKDFKLRYRRSVLGVAWSVLNPLLMMIVMSAVFSTFMRYADDSISCYPLYLIIGNTAFQLMSDATSTGLRSIIDAAGLLKKVKINRYIFPIQKVLSATVNYLFSLIAVFCVMLWFHIPFTPLLLLMPVGVAFLVVFCIGMSLLLCTLATFFRDVIHLWGVVLTAWTYATPLFYPESILPPGMKIFEAANPMYCYVEWLRDTMLWARMPTLSLFLRCLIFAVLACVIGYAAFHKHEHNFILYI
ncbi:ABC transporter permease [Atopobium sp. oral taxon 416]|uniref:ABC transporter permease n=1 Tax=Atopobium sp. oral taxon 416 TaxID=712157 RepID=UPI001BA9D98B|nr:ABC transporter permease [Atopobium sp. oral taxon 416]QUC02090.1 ABC transporter permease [Atopobium sp. oral taxon 416]